MLPDLDSLRCFVVAAETENFRRAAARVALSPAAFSERIKRLEETVGATLFVRSRREVRLTDAGRRMLDPARQALATAADCVTAALAEGRVAPFTLNIGTRFELGLSWLLPALDELRAARPERRLDLYFGSGPDILDRVLRGLLDAAVTSARLTDAGLAYAALHEERYAFCAAPSALARAPLAGPADAARHRLIDVHADLPLFRYFQDARSPAEVWAFAEAEHVSTIAAVRARVLDGAGVAVLPAYFVAADLAAGALVALMPCTEPGTDWFRLVWRAGHAQAAELRALAETLRGRPLR
ncbi:MAG: LysR family transcriptional regulator [Myxococcales bacterium]|nr:LysR family transcriptional regulator [Myxococcales bacterium]